ncbi:DUF4811 domain-containing protein [Staphylococcus lugdunensis]|uniref:DUF4811 domain-containing protein n=1 Tax=Staphylococcus lugdunensis TaxID=28035 RepID=A0ABX6BTJ6_STALU|nr:DUF4811 domain-containing protein [Staphylococcus lugdunensis]ADC86565.1 hypothetical protein SLGD_00417 [Staphylococcus lugdunensis HKU09-01]ARJ08304.1 DUF4811 domain-containing protein [Staphylococcus lugdunensis]ARJ15394.1 DUF4811 domain-containing protein [Staphylococcus lugdunensis]ARJ28778.1 DUF4811 domain-containing protein [Staphylococcus lugdunensis]EKS23980.1 hypothetical protein HMPREF9308_01062 [Staphylococcus lugdunensis ACS-027-V-Sch2]
MIILIILTIALFASWLLIPQKLSRYIIGSIVTFLFVVQIIGIVANMTHHFGMQKETIHESEKRIYSAANSKSPAQMLIANEIGNNSNNYVMVYKDNKDDTKATAHFKPKTTKEDISESTKKQAYYETSNDDNATLKNTKEYWVWKNKYYRYLFDFGKEDKELIKETSVVTVPDDTWVVLNAQEAKKLQKQQSKLTKNFQKKAKEAIQNKIITYKKEHPKASDKTIKAIAEKEQKRYITQQIKDMMK